MVRKLNEQADGKQNVVNEIYRSLRKAGYDVFYFTNHGEEIGINIDDDIDIAKDVMREVKGLLLNMGAKVKTMNSSRVVFDMQGYEIDVKAYPTDVAITVYEQ